MTVYASSAKPCPVAGALAHCDRHHAHDSLGEYMECREKLTKKMDSLFELPQVIVTGEDDSMSEISQAIATEGGDTLSEMSQATVTEGGYSSGCEEASIDQGVHVSRNAAYRRDGPMPEIQTTVPDPTLQCAKDYRTEPLEDQSKQEKSETDADAEDGLTRFMKAVGIEEAGTSKRAKKSTDADAEDGLKRFMKAFGIEDGGTSKPAKMSNVETDYAIVASCQMPLKPVVSNRPRKTSHTYFYEDYVKRSRGRYTRTSSASDLRLWEEGKGLYDSEKGVHPVYPETKGSIRISRLLRSL